VVVIPIMVVVMIVPVPFGMPAMRVFIPPFVESAPAILAGLVQLVPRALRLGAVPPMMLSRFVEPVVGLHKAMPASIVIRHSSRSRTQQQESAQRRRRQYSFPQPLHTLFQETRHEFFPPKSAQGRG
jgi:hypothetical protein